MDGRKVVLIEERKSGDDGGSDSEVDSPEVEDEEDGGERRGTICRVWEERVPMLNGSVRRTGLENEGVWSGRTVEVGRLLARWFKFRKGDWDSQDSA
jgi:hypothetical protein